MTSSSLSHSQQKSGLILNDNLQELAAKRSWLFEVVTPPETQTYYPSNTVEEDILYAISYWNYVLSLPVPERKQLIREDYFYHLHCVTAEEMGETFRCIIPNATILNPTGLVITSDFQVICQSLDNNKLNIDIDTEQVKNRLYRGKILPGTYVSLLSYWSHTFNFAHWLMDCLPKLALLESLDSDIKQNLNYIIPGNSPAYITDSLELLGIQRKQIIKIEERNITVDRLVLCCASERSGRPQKAHLLSIRDKLFSAVVRRDSQQKATKRVYISRSESSRKIMNEHDLLPILVSHNFEIVYCESLSLAEQISLFSEANVILGAHGAGIYNQIFCNSGATVIEIYNKDYWHHSSRNIASFMGHKHWHIFGDNINDNWQTWVDPSKLAKILSLALNR
jgi:hypothetical protein